ncbi:high-affinity cell membrane calcium channel [Gigaspora margarita]|uniref:Calcium-channel protein CCH1 n=1 Tax=Gigaspora margarita TaxID=4874 RepID=A0A8H3X1T7_GIGMA|nr:high-affinity cell membrane calcium channel [Gigaspora margarita]
MERKDGLSSDVPLVEFINPNETNIITQSIPSQSRSHNPRDISSPISPSITLHDDDIFSRDRGDQQRNTMPSFLSRRVTTGSDDNEENYVEMTNISKRLSLTKKKHKQISFDHQDENYTQDPSLLNRMPSFKKFKRLSRMVTRASSRVVNLANVPLDQLPKEGGPSEEKERNSVLSETSLNDKSLETPLTIVKSKSVLEGRSLFIFGPNNPVRLFFYEVLSNPTIETFILFLICANIILLVIDAWDTVSPTNPRRTTWGSSFVDYGLLAIFILYTLEIIARIVVSGFIINPDNNDESFDTTLQANTKSSSVSSLNNQKGQILPGIKRSVYKTAFLRHSFNRIDLVAVICYWIDLVLTICGVSHVYVFKALSTLRSFRLLTVTSGGSTILQSLKISAPLLVNVLTFISFFFVIISIIGIQAFKGSFRRQCVWVDPSGSSNYTLSQQWCGGYIGQDGNHYPYISTTDHPLKPPIPKGYLCPVGQVCQEGDNPYNNMVSYDNIFSAMVLTFVLAATQNWTDLLYRTMDTDYGWSTLYYVLSLFILNFWLLNLFVAVIVAVFEKIREETSHSAFTTSKSAPVLLDDEGKWTLKDHKKIVTNRLGTIMKKLKYLFVFCIFIDLFIMGCRTFDTPPNTVLFIDRAELVFTLILAAEIILRFFSYYPKFWFFFHARSNTFDLFLVIVTCLIQIPLIKSSPAYPYLTIFQIARVYRIVIAVPRLKTVLMSVLGSVAGLANLVLFILMINFFAAISVVQLLRGSIPSSDNQSNSIIMTFSDIYNSFLAMYQLFSSSDWTTVLYNVFEYESVSGSVASSIIAALFISFYTGLSNFVLLNMFIAVVQENFAIAEEEKHKIQVESFRRNADPTVKKDVVIERWNIYRFFKEKPKALAVENIPSSLVLHTQKSRVKELLEDDGSKDKKKKMHHGIMEPADNFIMSIKRFFGYVDTDYGPIHESDLNRHSIHHTDYKEAAFDPFSDPVSDKQAEEFIDSYQERQALKADFIAAHPSYAASLWCISPHNSVRRICQLLVPSSYGKRIQGVSPSPTWSFLFSAFIYSCIIASVVLACITTPAYQKQYYEQYGVTRYTWFWLIDLVFAFIFTLEFIIKVIADGFLFTPNAYMLNVWNVLDLFVLSTIYVNIILVPTDTFGSARIIRAFKALRALRLINLSTSIKNTFYYILIAGAPRIFDASILSISLIIPFALYGINIFSGLLYNCNDNSNTINANTDCTGEFAQNILNWNVLIPRVWDNPYHYSFDDFKSALLILFESLSNEGWINIMFNVMAITGYNNQPQPNAAKWNAVYWLVFNLVGTVFVLTLFISVIILSFQSKSGVAYLTQEQVRWLNLEKLLRQIKPSKLPKVKPNNPFRAFCYDYAVEKRGTLYNIMTGFYVFHIILLMTEFFGAPTWWEMTRNIAFLLLISVYIIEVSMKLAGLGWKVFRSNPWNLYDLIVIIGTIVTTIPALTPSTTSDTTVQLQKLFLVLVTIKLFQKSDPLNQLFKNVIASVPPIFNLFAVWFIIFVIYAIMYMEIFGLTKYGQNGTQHVNFRNFDTTMLTLIRMSTGENWNSIMHDYTVTSPFCVQNSNYLLSDCGSAPWAYFLFISWNVLSMYIIFSMFVGVVGDSFSYFYQISGTYSSINREEIRKFKKAWGAIDVKRTGYIKSKDLSKFFGKLEGSFRVKIFDDEFLIPNLRKNSRVTHRLSEDLDFLHPKDDTFRVEDIDVKKLEKNLSRLDIRKTFQSRKTYNLIYQEALMTIERDAAGNEKGISFTNMLLLLAHYKLIDDEKCLEIHEYVKRQIKLKKVIDSVNRERVKSLLRTILWRKKFRAFKNLKSVKINDDDSVPRITVNDDPNARVPTLSIETMNISQQHMSITSPSEQLSARETLNIDTPEFSRQSDSFGVRTRSFDHSSGEFSLSSGEEFLLTNNNNVWSNIDANTEMDEQTADQVLTSLQSNYWHDTLQEMSQGNSSRNQ